VAPKGSEEVSLRNPDLELFFVGSLQKVFGGSCNIQTMRASDIIEQGFPTCGTRTTSSTRRYSRWYASNFHFFTKTWIHMFLVYISGFVSEKYIFLYPAIPIGIATL